MITQLVAKYYTLLRSENKVCSKKDYWIFILITIFFKIVLIFVSAIFSYFYLSILNIPVLLIYAVIDIMIIVLSIKRLHDANLSGFWIFIPILLFSQSVTKNNKYNIKEEIPTTDEDKNLLLLINELEKTKEK